MIRFIAIAALATLTFATILAVQAPLAAGGTVYKCTDADGKTYYAGQPCPESAKSETLRVPQPSTTDEPVGEGDGKSLDERIAAATDPVIKAQLELEKQRCELARTQLQRYEDAPYLVEKREDGSERKLSEEETRAERDRLRRKIESRCT